MSSPLLNYAIHTNPNPLTAGLTNGGFTLLATNPTNNPISIEGIEITIQVGTSSDKLTNQAAQIAVGIPAGWKQNTSPQSPGLYSFLFVPQTGTSLTISPGDSVYFTLSNIALNNIAGVTEITIKEGSSGYPTISKSVSIFPSGWGGVSFNLVSASNLPGPGNVILNWSGPAGATYSIQYLDPPSTVIDIPAPGEPVLSNVGIYPGVKQPALTISQTTTFTLSVSEVVNGILLETTPQVTVSVAQLPPVIDHFTGTITQGPNGELAIKLSWSTQHAAIVQGSWTSNTLDANPTSPTIINNPSSASYFIKAVSSNGTESPPSTITLEWQLGNLITSNIGVGNFVITPDNQYALCVSNNSSDISVFELPGMNFIQSITVGNDPIIITVTPNGNYAFVNSKLGTAFWVINLNNLNVLPQVINTGFSPGGFSPLSFAVAPGSNQLLITDNNSVNVEVYDINNIAAPPQVIQANAALYGTVFSTSGDYAFAAALYNNQVFAFPLYNLSLPTQIIDTGAAPYSLVASGNYVFSINQNGNSVSAVNINNLSAPAQTIPVGMFPSGAVVTPDGNYLFVANTNSNNVSVIDVNNLSAPPVTIGVNPGPSGIGISPDGNYVFTGNGDGSVSVIRTSHPMANVNTLYPGIQYMSFAFATNGKQGFVFGVNSNGNAMIYELNLTLSS